MTPLRSLRARLTVVFAASMVVLLCGLGAFIYLQMATELSQEVDRSLGSRADALFGVIVADPGQRLSEGHRFADADEAFAQILDPAGHILDATTGATVAPILTPAQAHAITSPTYLTHDATARADAVRILAVPAVADGNQRILVLGATLGDRHDALHHLLMVYAISAPAGLGLASLAGWLLAGAALRPVDRIRSRAAQISDSDLDALLPVPRTGDELTRLATTLNELLGRLHAALRREHRFVDDASHELRTPLAVLKAELDLALTKPRTSQEYRATVLAAAAETDRLIQLCEDLLVLARVRKGHFPLRRSPTHLPTLLEQVAMPLRADLSAAGRELELRCPYQTVLLDPARVRQALTNLLQNSLRHGRGTITLTATVLDHNVDFEICDQGPGFPRAILTTVFQPFTHGPPPGQGLAPGAGLGLAIVQAVASAHHGTAVAENQPTGARVLLSLGTRGSV